MFRVIKKILPEPLKNLLVNTKLKTYDQWQKKRLFKRMRSKHAALVQNIKGKKKIKVVFLAIHKSVWKVDPVFKKMLDDPFFEPLILVCPYTSFDDEVMWSELADTYEHYMKSGYPVMSAYIEREGRWLDLDNLKPDIVFFTNPYQLTKYQYYEKAYTNYLCCYVPYYFMATTHAGDLNSQLNTPMLNAMWRIYWPHDYILEKFRKHSAVKGKNSSLTGYPATEVFLNGEWREKKVVKAWQNQESKKKKIIYAPHHTIENEDSSLSTFLEYGNFIKQLSKEYKDEVQWSFKPHPMLKEKLRAHPDWGDKRTNDYYQYWIEGENTQLDLGGYDDLFNESDALIHDCSSFIVEYSFTKKPVLYLLSQRANQVSFLNEFGEKVFKTHEKAKHKQDIINFLSDVVSEKIVSSTNENNFFGEYLKELYINMKPSQRVIDDIKSSLI